ncbi:major facilitator superfamily domain-containing protein [Xylariales sp. PMI_506]|nr:major facilitator superfamily domain-containing protein [Xylariales sp. PMI_506]
MAQNLAGEISMKGGTDVSILSPQPTNKAAPEADSLRDEALNFLQQHKNEASLDLTHDRAFTKALRRKIDWRLTPFFWLCYTLNYVDKVLLNLTAPFPQYANIMGMPAQLHLQGNNYSTASSSFFITVLLFSLPNIWLLNRLPVAKVLATCLIGWSICSMCHAALQNYAGLVTLRVLSGAFESAVLPCLMLLSSQYYTYTEQAVRFGFWYMGMGTGQILGGLISFAFQHISPTAPLASWKTMFLVLGLITLALGCFVLLFVPDSPMSAKFLTSNEKVILLEHVKINQTGIENKNFHARQLLEGLIDPGCWFIFLITILNTIGSGVVTAYSALILTSFGYTPKQAALLNMPSGVVNILATLLYTTTVRFFGRRWLVVSAAGAIGAMAAALLSFLPNSNKPGLLVAIYLINALPGGSIVAFQWLTCNTAGHTKRTYATAGVNAAFAIGNIIGPLTFQAKDAPQYKPAKLALVIAWAASILISFFCYLYYTLMNKSRGVKSESDAEEVSDTEAYGGLTDKQNPNFRYHT